MTNIVPLHHVPAAQVEQLLDHAFGPDRKSRTAYQLRAGTTAIVALSFAMTSDQGVLLGTIQCWPVALLADDGTRTPLVMVGPVAVEPDVQQSGIGKALMQAMLDAANAAKAPPLMMIGDPEYYERFFGFSADATQGWSINGPVEQRRVLARLRADQSVPADGRIIPGVPI